MEDTSGGGEEQGEEQRQSHCCLRVVFLEKLEEVYSEHGKICIEKETRPLWLLCGGWVRASRVEVGNERVTAATQVCHGNDSGMRSRKRIWKESSGQWVVWEGLTFVFYGTMLHKESFKD